MQNVINKDIDKWKRPWHIEKFNELIDRDERFFSLVVKGALAWLNDNIYMYNKPIRHFIFNTGSTYMYVESNGYDFKWAETTGEDWMYMETPRCLFTLDTFTIPTEDLSMPYVRGIYERVSSEDGQVHGYNAEMRRLPIEITANLEYVLSNFNESIVLLQELYDTVVFQQYFNINYLGQVINCSIEFGTDNRIEFPAPDLMSTDVQVKTIGVPIKICTNYPLINTRTESRNDAGLIASAVHNTSIIVGMGTDHALKRDDINRNRIESSEVYRDTEYGFYSKFSKKFYADESYETLITPNMYTIYVDISTDTKTPYHWDGKEYLRDYDYALLDSLKE